MKKSKLIAIVLIVALISSIATFSLSNIFEVRYDDKVIVSTNRYESLIHLEKKYEKAERLEEFISENYYEEIPIERIQEGVLHGLFQSLDDPYSNYMNEKEFEEFTEQSTGTYGGIGIIVTAGKGDFITIVSPIEDTPGEAAGLKSGDKIIEANGTEVFSETMDEAIDIMKGEPNTDVTLKIKRGQEIFDVSITRELIVLKSVKSRVVEDYGVLRITMFDNKVSEEFDENLKNLLSKDIEGLIIDLRSNPGGSLSGVVEIADKILGEQLIVYTETREGVKQEYSSDPSKIDLPITVLVNEGSASASEILTGAIQDSESGTVIGTNTFGKGLVQSVMPLNDGTGFKLTTSQYFTPNGRYIHDVGIAPDITVELPESYFELEDPTDSDDVQLQKAIEVLNNL
ncbi:MAG TPA: S41 family peptidase [Clostridia bacterium]|nr:S41 family peptidase [Clostridia bacterium]